MNKQTLKEILEKHSKWLNGEEGGERAVLRKANLRKANLHKTDLREADLRWADLRKADLSRANLREANLSKANLQEIKEDLFSILEKAKDEIPMLLEALKNGNVDGSVYEGECACLVGTIANIRGINYKIMNDIKPDPNRPIERWFFGIKKGDTPENNPISEITVEWIEEFFGK